MKKTLTLEDCIKHKAGNYYSTRYYLFYKDGGTKYYIDQVDFSGNGIYFIRNSKTGKSDIILNSDLTSGRHSKSYFFSM